jgi:hypothetical protein
MQIEKKSIPLSPFLSKRKGGLWEGRGAPLGNAPYEEILQLEMGMMNLSRSRDETSFRVKR